MCTHVIYACGYKGYIHFIHAYEFKTVLNILAFKQVMRNEIINLSKIALKNGDDLTNLNVNLNM